MRTQDKEKRNARIAMDVLEAFRDRDAEKFAELLADDFVWVSDAFHPYPGKVVGPNQTYLVTKKLFQIFPNLDYQVTSIVARNDQVAFFSTNTGTVTVGNLGLPPIRAPYRFAACDHYYFEEDGKILHKRTLYDQGWLLAQQGVIPNVGVIGPAPGERDPNADFERRQHVPPSGPDGPPRQVTADLISRVVRLPIDIAFHSLDSFLGSRQR